MAFTIGIDFGTNSARCLVARCADGAELGTAAFHYPSGEFGILLDSSNHNLARQRPSDYLEALARSVRAALSEAEKTDPAFSRSKIVGIGVDTTGSSPIPVDSQNVPLAPDPRWRDDLNAQCWLWKDHTSIQEALAITELGRALRPQYLAKCGNTYSSEWFWSKIWHCLNVAPSVFEAAYSWVELSEWIPSMLAGASAPEHEKRSVCAAGHKALYAEDWGGLPDKISCRSWTPAWQSCAIACTSAPMTRAS